MNLSSIKSSALLSLHKLVTRSITLALVVSKHAVKGSQKEKRGQKGQDVWNDRGTFEARICYRPAQKQLRQPEGCPVFEENTYCGVPE